MVTRTLLYAGWAIGGLGLISAGPSRVWAGGAVIVGGLLLLGAALTDVADGWGFTGNHRVLNATLALIALCWLGLGTRLVA